MNWKIMVSRQTFANMVTLMLIGGLAIFLASPSLSRKFFYAAAIFAVIGLLLYRDKPRREIAFLLVGIALFSFYRIGHTYIVGQGHLTALTEQRYVDSGKRLLMCGIVCYFYAVVPFSLFWRRYVFFAVLLSLCLGAVVVGWQLLQGLQRPGGELVATSFAYSVAMIFMFYQAALLRLPQLTDFWQFLLVFALTLVTILSSGTRSALILVLVVGLFRLASLAKYHGYRYSSLVVVSVLFVLAWPLLYAKVLETLYDFSVYYSGNNRTLSLGGRFEMWRLAMEAIQQYPVWGAGYANRLQLASHLTSNHTLDPIVNMYVVNHLHSELLDEWSVRGAIGVVMLLIFYAAPLTLGGGPLRSRAFGLMLTCMILGLGDVLFQDRANTIILCLLLPLCVGLQLSENTCA